MNSKLDGLGDGVGEVEGKGDCVEIGDGVGEVLVKGWEDLLD